jgi:hypothetical protein
MPSILLAKADLPAGKGAAIINTISDLRISSKIALPEGSFGPLEEQLKTLEDDIKTYIRSMEQLHRLCATLEKVHREQCNHTAQDHRDNIAHITSILEGVHAKERERVDEAHRAELARARQNHLKELERKDNGLFRRFRARRTGTDGGRS